MLHREAKACRQSPLDKAAKWGEGALRILGTAKGIYDAGKTIYNVAQAAAPYAQAAMALL
jgi:hypothetical protein